jgi:hypothetical protein
MLDGTREKSVVASLKVLSQRVPGRTEENIRNIRVTPGPPEEKPQMLPMAITFLVKGTSRSLL